MHETDFGSGELQSEASMTEPSVQGESTSGDVLREPAASQPDDDWTLLVGQQIEIHEQGRIIDTGRVEDVTRDGCILWLQMEGSRCRRLIQKSTGTCLKIL
jgi:hypothetical protein